MYCVRCGVRLQDGVDSCPLCGTPVWDPERPRREHSYPDRYPGEQKESRLPFAVAMTVICVMAIAVILAVCLKLYGRLNWGGYAIGGIALFYVVAVLPAWFRRPPIEVFVPAGHAAAALYVLFICLRTGGNWFLSFAFPVILISCLLFTAVVCLLKHVRGGRLFILGGALLALGGATVLIEFFEHISFGVPMFLWSLYSLIGFAVAGGFLLLAGMIPSLRGSLEKRFFF
ncbi:MAG: hypothetical protein IJH78_06350 [Clostridia bacterium]|nr:hypothetical protein [Clostridia bacterium]